MSILQHLISTGPATIGDPLRNVERIADALIVLDGATVTSHGAPYAGTGIAVAIPEHATILDSWAHSDDDVRAWIRAAMPAVLAHASRAFGSWVQGNRLYLDVVELFSDAEEAEAMAAAVYRGELAVFHHGRQQCIPVGLLDDRQPRTLAQLFASDTHGLLDVDDEQPDREPSPEQERAWDLREDDIRGHALGGE